ncbi:sperm-specific H1/protamine-like protein type 2 isoform X2 [Macrobrachium rosenbergii]|uniref:sperm-specific H1/protamine-like protein type 2 isoform X2 n=1 Tax=Macrobrachium rosenbergii TaxID=79674 RepID=UPI0034D4705E
MSEEDAKADTGGEESAEEERAETSGDAEEEDDSAGDAAEGDDDGGPKKKQQRKRGPPKGSKRGSGGKKKVKRTHPKTTDMIIEAIETLAERKGSSYQAIKAYILQNFKTVRPDMIRSMMRRSLKSGLEQSIFARPKGQLNTHGMSGRYLLGKHARREEEEEVMPQKSKRAQAVAALKAKKSKKMGKKRSKARRPFAKKAKGRK